MSKITIVGGDIIEKIGGRDLSFAKGEIINSGSSVIQTGQEKGVSFGTPSTPPSLEETQVREIECLTELDDGSANDGTGVNTQKGILYNKSYVFRAKEFSNGVPKNYRSIKWKISYTDPETNIYVDNILSDKDYRGSELNVTFTSNTHCGCNLEVKAFISDDKKEGIFSVFMHNRFRWFDKKIFESQLQERVDFGKPWKIHQSSTSLCGMACLFYLLAKDFPVLYKEFAKALFRIGEATCNEYTATPSEKLLNKKPRDSSFPSNMPYIDFITLAGVRNTENRYYKGGDEEFQAINWPNIMVNLCEKLLGYKEVSYRGIYNPIKKSSRYDFRQTMEIISDINIQFNNGCRLILMIDSDLINDTNDSILQLFSFEYHWVVLETPITIIENSWNSEGRIVPYLDFKVYSWGTKEIYLKQPISIEHFINNYYGYIKAKE